MQLVVFGFSSAFSGIMKLALICRNKSLLWITVRLFGSSIWLLDSNKFYTICGKRTTLWNWTETSPKSLQKWRTECILDPKKVRVWGFFDDFFMIFWEFSPFLPFFKLFKLSQIHDTKLWIPFRAGVQPALMATSDFHLVSTCLH